MDTCVCMAESIHCSPKTTTTLLIGYNPIQKKTFKVTEKKKKKILHTTTKTESSQINK